MGEYSVSTRLWLFILFQWTAFLFMAALRAMVPDVPEDVTIQLERTDFLSSKVRPMNASAFNEFPPVSHTLIQFLICKIRNCPDVDRELCGRLSITLVSLLCV